MKKLIIYLDTSVLGGCFDEEFKEGSLALFQRFKDKVFTPAISTVVLEELLGAPQHIRDVVAKLEGVIIYELNDSIRALAKRYLQENIVPRKYSDDALHIAIATFYGADVLVSWNFKHIVNLNRIHGFNAANLREGYKALETRNPNEVIYE